MMDKERLEEIENNLDPLGYGMGGHLISVNDIYWLVKYAREQSERVEELESRIADDEHFVAEILEQNKRYREALEFYANKINYLTFIENGKSNIEHDQGEKARQALEGEE